MRSNCFGELIIIHFRSPRFLLNLVCHYLCGLPAVNFRSRVRHRSLREREYQRAPGRTFKCKCTFLLIFICKWAFLTVREEDSGLRRYRWTPTRESSSPHLVRTSAKSSLARDAGRQLLHRSHEMRLVRLNEIVRRDFENFNHWQRFAKANFNDQLSRGPVTYYFLL